MRCWYCGTADASVIFEREHQVPVALGGGAGANLVDACQPCNRLKGSRTAEQFRAELELRLGHPVVFAGEASPERAATDITSVRSFAAPTGLVRLPEELLDEVRTAVLSLRAAGYASATLGSFVTDAIRAHLDRLHSGALGPAELGPQELPLFETT
jgi:hypothetical protein